MPAARVTEARFVAGAGAPAAFPRHQWPEVAFAGRSNVGKSSLLNRLTGRRALARVSATPGRTQQLNFFLVDGRLVFVDLPGYGFAKVPLRVKEVWKALVESYLTDRSQLRGAVVIVDLRRGVEADDHLLLEFLQALGIPAILAATKIDKLARDARQRHLSALRLQPPAGARAVVAVAATTGEGVAELWREIEAMVRDRPSRPQRGAGGRSAR